mmetsp:Transcript_18242/g.58028  ORF Transcript_18242/g.58028 Transcript_18242/m.58028 type:complete len:262 (+) Transcript_18242:3-788(+)
MPLVMVGLIMGTLYFAFVGCCVPLSGIGLLGAGPLAFNATFVLALVSYYQCVMTDPGSIPDTWRASPDVLACIKDRLVERKRTTGELRFCAKERKYKPDRAHYCKALERNVLRMDHYCPWMSNCIGFYNHKFFVLFLLYTVVSATIALFCIVQALACQVLPAGTTAFLLGTSALAALLVSVLAPFLVLHFWLLGRNMTTLEFCEQMGGKGGYTSLYDVGMFENFRTVLGESIWLWFVPVGGPGGEGLFWPRSQEAGRGKER